MKPGGLHHVAICVHDAEEAMLFYTGVLGFGVVRRPGSNSTGYWLSAGGQVGSPGTELEFAL